MKMILDLFTGYSVTCYKDAHATAFSASPNSSVATETEVELTVTPASGYEVDEIEVIEGGVTIVEEDGDYSFVMGSANVVLNLKTKANNKYMVTEDCFYAVNDTRVHLNKNSVVELTKNGVPKAVTALSGGASITVNDAVQSLIDQGILVKL